MNHSNLKHVDEAVAPGAAMTNLFAEMIGLGAFLAGQAPLAMMQAGVAAVNLGVAANELEQPIDMSIDDLFDNVPV